MIGVGLFIGAMIGWIACALFMYGAVVKHCPSAEGTQCEQFGDVKVCVVGK